VGEGGGESLLIKVNLGTDASPQSRMARYITVFQSVFIRLVVGGEHN
jgi:hypothetical protein